MSKLTSKNVFRIFLALVLLLLVAQVIPVPRSNPPVETEPEFPAEVRVILEKACYDCHSHATTWPWYSRVAPMSWLMAWDVMEGREHLNFSLWNRLSPKQQAHKWRESAELVEEGEMPPWIYLPTHPEARLSPKEVQLLLQWFKQQANVLAPATPASAQ